MTGDRAHSGGDHRVWRSARRRRPYGTTWPKRYRLSPRFYTLAGKPLFTGAVTAEFTMSDAQTGKLLAAGVDQVAGEQHRTRRKISGSWCDVKTGLDSWTDLSTYRLCVLRGGSHCVELKA